MTLTAGFVEELEFVNNDLVDHTVVFGNGQANGPCSIDVPPGSNAAEYGCFPRWVGTHSYVVDGKFTGTVHIGGAARSVSLIARTHTVRLGSQLTLHGKLTLSNLGAPFCSKGLYWPRPLNILARHDASHRFTRIAMFHVGRGPGGRAINDRCTFFWSHEVRPGVTTTYIAEAKLGGNYWRRARSNPFTVRIRP